MNSEEVLTRQLANGFRIHVIVKPEYIRTTMALSVDFGSVDSQFELNGQAVSQPAGIAHFLEHQLFDKDGYDVTEKFAAMGADSNAFTSYTKTSYLASTTEEPSPALRTLVEFVSTPYFSAENVAKEKGIIAQEINMYADDPDNQLYVKTIQNMYQQTTLANDVAGSVESIKQISSEDLKLAYASFYRADNMNLVVVGNVDPDSIFKVATEALNSRSDKTVVRKLRSNLVGRVANNLKIESPVVLPKYAIGLKGSDSVAKKMAGIKYEIAVSIVLDLFFSETATTYNELYEEGGVDDSFSYEFENEDGFHFAMLLGNANEPNETINRLEAIVKSIPAKLADMQPAFELQKKELIGNYIEMLDSESAIVSQFTDFKDQTDSLFDELQIIERLEFADLVQLSTPFFENAVISRTIVEL